MKLKHILPSFLCCCAVAQSADYLWRENASTVSGLSEGAVPVYQNGVWLSYRPTSNGVSAIFRSAGQADVVLDWVDPRGGKIEVLSQSLNKSRQGVLTVRIVRDKSRSLGALVFLDANNKTARFIDTEPYLLQRGIIDDNGLIWALATLRDSEGKHVEGDHPALITINPQSGERSTILRRTQMPHSSMGAHSTWGAARTHAADRRFTAFFPTENELILVDEMGKSQTVKGPPGLETSSVAIAVLRCGQEVFLSVQQDARHGMFRMNLDAKKWDDIAWRGHSSLASAAPRLTSCQADNSIEVALGGKTVGTLTPIP
jgi:hypothetical protein